MILVDKKDREGAPRSIVFLVLRVVVYSVPVLFAVKNIITKEARAPIKDPKNESHTVLSPTMGVNAGMRRMMLNTIGTIINPITKYHQYFLM